MESKDFGIHALEVYFPRYFVPQSDLEEADDCIGKYTNGLGQSDLGVCSVEEDVNSICLTVLSNLIERLQLDLSTIGFMEVGSETLIDKSKSTKTVLMQLFKACGNMDIEGVDTKNACFGGTAALFHALNWLESSAWDGRFALVIAADIAVYGTKSARPTGGAGAVAMLLGPNAPLVVDPGLRAHHMEHRYDFYKPDLSSEYPTVDGQLSIQSYKEALLQCYAKYKQKVLKRCNQTISILNQTKVNDQADHSHPIDFMCFHSPFTRLVRKAFGWIGLEDARAPGGITTNGYESDSPQGQLVKALNLVSSQESNTCAQNDRTIDNLCVQATRKLFTDKVEPGLTLAKHVGNMYTASLYGCLVSLLLNLPETSLRGRRILLYSYGSGMASSMFSMVVHPERCLKDILGPYSMSTSTQHPLLHRLHTERTQITVDQFTNLLDERNRLHNTAPVNPAHRPEGLFPGSYYLTQVDERYRRFYDRI